MATELAEFADLLFRARLAAAEAAASKIKENPKEWYPCGFAWVTIKPARGKFVSFLKNNSVGHAAHDGGWTIWNPSNNHTQWMDAKMAGAEAFAAVLRAGHINANADCRMD